MATELEHEERSLEAEFEELQRDERALKDRMQKSQLAMLVAVVLAVVASIAALVVALDKTTSTSSVIMRGTGSTATQGRSGTMGPGMMSGSAARSGVASRVVNVQLGEMFVRPSAGSITAGKVTFVAHNGGQLPHELMIERVPIKLDGPGRPNEDAAMGMVKDMMPGGSGRMTLTLKPGTYELFCNVTGHYAAGQHTTFTVTKS